MRKSVTFFVLTVAFHFLTYGAESDAFPSLIECAVSEATYDFIEDYCLFMRTIDHDHRINRFHNFIARPQIMNDTNAMKAMAGDLDRIGGGFSHNEYDLHVEKGVEAERYIENTVINPAIQKGIMFIVAGNDDKRLVMADALIKYSDENNVDLDNDKADRGLNDYPFFYRNASIIKASGAAAVTGLATYYAIGCYNKDKSKERQLSKLKWSLGVALVVGAGTYLWLR